MPTLNDALVLFMQSVISRSQEVDAAINRLYQEQQVEEASESVDTSADERKKALLSVAEKLRDESILPPLRPEEWAMRPARGLLLERLKDTQEKLHKLASVLEALAEE